MQTVGLETPHNLHTRPLEIVRHEVSDALRYVALPKTESARAGVGITVRCMSGV